MNKFALIASVAICIFSTVPTSAKWQAMTQKAYGWNGAAWQLDEIYRCAYNSAGQIMTKTITDADGSVNRETYRWDINGMLISRLNEYARSASAPFQQTQRLTRTYDERITSFITFNDQLIKQGTEWIPSNNYKQTVTRNEDGNVIQMERAIYYGGIYDPTYHINIEYGADGKATAISTEDLQYDYDTKSFFWKPGTSYKEIVWESTDGQIVSIDNLFDGANRLKSAIVTINGEDCHISAEYAGDGSWTSRRTFFDEDMDMDLEEKIEYTPTDAYGSSQVIITMGYVEDGKTYSTEQYTYTYKYSPDGLLLLEEEVFSNDEGTETVSRIEGTIEYDSEHGYPLTWTLSEYDPEAGKQINTLRAEYSDYIQTGTDSSITYIETGGKAPQLFDLNGRRVTTPSAGKILISKSASAAKKLIF